MALTICRLAARGELLHIPGHKMEIVEGWVGTCHVHTMLGHHIEMADWVQSTAPWNINTASMYIANRVLQLLLGLAIVLKLWQGSTLY